MSNNKLASIEKHKENQAKKVPAEYAEILLKLQEQSQKLATDNSQLISAWKDYLAIQNQLQADYRLIATRAAMASGFTVEQLDASDLKSDGNGGFEWVARTTGQASEAYTPTVEASS